MIVGFRGSQQLRKEIAQWHDEGIINEHQAQQLYERYELLGEAPWYTRSSFIVSALAIFVVTLGLFLIISENWHSFSIPVRVSMAALPLIGTYVLGWWLNLKERTQQAELSFFFSCLLLGLNIFLQAQIFHISGYAPNGLWWWMIGTIPFAFILRSGAISALYQILFCSWFIIIHSDNRFDLWFVPALLLGVYLSLRHVSVVNLLASITSISLAILFSSEHYDDAFTHVSSVAFVIPYATAALFVLAVLPDLSYRFPESLRSKIASILRYVVLLSFLILSFHSSSPSGYELIPSNGSAWFLLTVSLVGLIITMLRRVIDAPSITIMLCTVVIISELTIKSFDYRMSFWIVANCTLLLVSAAHIWDGIRSQRKSVFMNGIFIVTALAISRYFNLVADYLLSAAVFIAVGVFLWSMNYLWNKNYAKQDSAA